MTKKLLFFLASIFILSGFLPAFAEVIELKLDNLSYYKGDSIRVEGFVSDKSKGLVTIVIRDPNGEFVLLNQAFIKSDSSFEKLILINNKFELYGSYNTTAFVQNITEEKIQSFNLLQKNEAISVPPKENLIELNSYDSNFENKDLFEEGKNESEIKKEVKENNMRVIEIPTTGEKKSLIADFVDKTKDPQHYLDRYYNEDSYKSWFDRNYPNLTIEEAVGLEPTLSPEPELISDIVDRKILPEAEAISVISKENSSSTNSDLAQMGLAIGGLAILFGAVYGIKKKVDNNSKHISLNKDIIRQKLISPLIDSNPIGIIQKRLAKGEISIEEYERLKEKLDKNFN